MPTKEQCQKCKILIGLSFASLPYHRVEERLTRAREDLKAEREMIGCTEDCDVWATVQPRKKQ